MPVVRADGEAVCKAAGCSGWVGERKDAREAKRERKAEKRDKKEKRRCSTSPEASFRSRSRSR